MLKPHVNHDPSQTKTLLLRKPFVNGNGCGGDSVLMKSKSLTFREARRRVRAGFRHHGNIKAAGTSPAEKKIKGGAVISVAEKKSIKVKAVVTVKQSIGTLIASLGIERGFHVELVSTELDPNTKFEKPTVKAFAHKIGQEDGEIKYAAEFNVPAGFGVVGAVFVENEHRREIFLQDIVLDGFPCGTITLTCDSWIHSSRENEHKRVFFTDKSYLPQNTPPGLRGLREEELALIRGNRLGERKAGDRIYDYSVYNDIGDPDTDPELARPVLGGNQHPYPRRCRTGRPRCETDPTTEKRKGNFYVPRDEAFSETKLLTFSTKTMHSMFQALIPSFGNVISNDDVAFPYLENIDSLFTKEISKPPLSGEESWTAMIPRFFKTLKEGTDDVLRFEAPETLERDKFFWMRDEEFARQTLAGVNPCCIQLVREWPLKSNLDPAIYGPPESAITKELVEAEIGGIMRLEEAIKKRKLFILDYHDLLLPFVSKVREIKGTTLYGSRTLFFLTPEGTLRPLAIELTRPKIGNKPQWKDVYRPCWNSTDCWLWRLAKAHVLAHDSGYHQLVSHWLRTHCATEPYIIASNRQLSVVHPIYRLLHPHFRYTLEINALARESLINAGGIIESSFTPGKYAMELCSAAYDQLWRFDQEGLPEDLIRRGMAVEDLTSPHGVKLTIEDYPYANDGLVLWGAIKEWVTTYVNHYYPEPSLITSDKELQAWWTEIRTVGHGDKKYEPWWPELKKSRNLIDILTTMIWITSGHHAAVNFGQYAFAGYFPNRPTIARIPMPTEDPTQEDWKFFLEKPESGLLATYPSKLQATRIMAVLSVLSNHSPDEEYMGETMKQQWAYDPVIKEGFEKFRGKLKELEAIIDERNHNVKFKNRSGAGILPYELLKPFSGPGVTGQGVPYSISI